MRRSLLNFMFPILPVMLIMAILTPLAAQNATEAIPAYDEIEFPPLKQVEIPTPQQITLSNGMRVFLLENHELPLVRGTAMIRTGNLFDPDDKRGLSQVMAEVLRTGGTSSKTGDEIDEELEDIAASVESSMGETSATIGFSGLSETTGQVLSVFKDVLTDPEFRQDKIDLVLNQLRGGIARRNDEASDIPARELFSILYGRDNSYGWTIEYEHLNNIERQDLIDFYQRYYFPENIMLGVYGDFDSVEMQAQLEALFSDWTANQPAVPAFPEVTNPPQPGIYFAPRTDVTQTFFQIGHLGGTLRDPDYPALEVMANILGSGFSSRLVSEIRTRLGYAYSIGSTWSANYNHPGVFRIGGSTKSASTVDTLAAIQGELEKIRTEPVTEQELADAKDAVLNSFVFFFDSPAKTLNRVMQYEYWGYPEDFLFSYQSGIEAVTREDVLRVAEEYVRPDELTYVAVGNPAEFGRSLTEIGTVMELDLTIPQPGQQTSEATEESLARGAELLARAQQAVGGVARLSSILDMTQSMDFELPAEAGGITVQQKNIWVAPNIFRQEQSLPGADIVAFTDGESGWIRVPQGTQDMPPAILAQAQGELFRQIVPLLLSDQDQSRQVNAVDENTIEISGEGQSVRVEFDPDSGLPLRQIYQGQGPNGAPVETFEAFLDWRDVEGMLLPFMVDVIQDGQLTGTAKVTGYEFNTGVDAAEVGVRP